MNQKAKRILFFTGLSLDVAITIFLFVVAIIMLATMPADQRDMKDAVAKNGPFIGYLQQHTVVYLCAFVIPLFVLLAANIVFLVLYVRKLSKKPEIAVDELSEAQKAALRAELLKDLQEQEAAKAEDKPEEK